MQKVFTGRTLVGFIKDKLNPPKYKELDYTFKRDDEDSYRVGDNVRIEKYNPVINDLVIPPVLLITHLVLKRQFLVMQPDDFFEAEASYYAEHFPFVFDDVQNTDEGDYAMAEWFQNDETGLTMPCSHTEQGEHSKEEKHVTVYIYESEDRDKDDSCIIITETYDPEDETYFINFLDGEEISDIDIEQEETL